MRPPVQGCVLKFIHILCLTQERKVNIRFTIVIKYEIIILSSLVIVNTECIRAYLCTISVGAKR